jgi:ribonuclease E
VPVDVAAYLLNEKRAALTEIEQVSKTRVLVIPNPNLETPHFDVQRLRDDEVDGDHEVSYNIDIAVPDTDAISDSHSADIPVQQAAVQRISPQAAPTPVAEQPATRIETPAAAPKKGLLARLWSGLVGEETVEPVEVKKPVASEKPAAREGQRPQGNNRRRRGGKEGEQRNRNQDGRRKEASSDDKREQPRRQRQDESGRGNGQGRRRGGRDGQQRRPEPVEDAANEVLETAVQETPDIQDSQDNREKPRKRPSDMKRGEPQRRRRNRSRKADKDVADTGAANADGNQEDKAAVVTNASPLMEADASPVKEASTETTAPVASAPEVGQAELPLEVAAAAPAEAVENTPEMAPVETALEAAVAEAETASVVEPVAAQEEQPRGAGLTEQGRAYNDPRVEPRAVGVVEIITAHPVLFGDFVAPPVEPSGRVALRASNDPRGPAVQEQQFAEASGQS